MIFLSSLIPVLAVFLGLLPILLIVFMIWRQKRRDSRRSPLTRGLMRPPGYSLRRKIDDIELDISLILVMAIMIPLFVFAMHISDSYFGQKPESLGRIVVSIVIGIGVSILAGWKLSQKFHQFKIATLGLEGELATGEELNQLMLEGCRVFHDIPYQYGNIDHVVVSLSGVFAVNTKLMGKLKQTETNAEIIVNHPRGVICFPDREYRIPVEKLEMEARWLSQQLTSSVGKPIEAESILALPGWFIKERIGRGSVYVINPLKPKKFFVQRRIVLTAELIQQVAHQLEQLCRDVEPSFQEKRKRWEDKK